MWFPLTNHDSAALQHAVGAKVLRRATLQLAENQHGAQHRRRHLKIRAARADRVIEDQVMDAGATLQAIVGVDRCLWGRALLCRVQSTAIGQNAPSKTRGRDEAW